MNNLIKAKKTSAGIESSWIPPQLGIKPNKAANKLVKLNKLLNLTNILHNSTFC